MRKGKIEQTLTTAIIVVAFFSGTINIAATPLVPYPEHWDCSETAYYSFKNEQRLGHEPVLVVGYKKDYAHAWVEDKDGFIIMGGERQWLYETFPDRYYYNDTIPKENPFGYNWEEEWVIA